MPIGNTLSSAFGPDSGLQTFIGDSSLGGTTGSGFQLGDFTGSQLPGGSLSSTAAGSGMVDLGGAGSMPGVDMSNPAVSSAMQTLTQKVGGQAAQSLLSKLINGTATAGDYASLLGNLGAAGLGLIGSLSQKNSLNNLANQYLNYGAPSRARYESSMTPGFDPTSIPGYAGALDSTSKSVLARLSATGGNPFGNPGGLIDANKQIVAGTALPAVQEYQRLNANTGFGSSMNAAVPLQTAAAGQNTNAFNAIGSGLSSIANPPQMSLSDIFKTLNAQSTPSLA